jgi:hypothetical protein
VDANEKPLAATDTQGALPWMHISLNKYGRFF